MKTSQVIESWKPPYTDPRTGAHRGPRSTCCNALLRLRDEQLQWRLWHGYGPVVRTIKCTKCGKYLQPPDTQPDTIMLVIDRQTNQVVSRLSRKDDSDRFQREIEHVAKHLSISEIDVWGIMATNGEVLTAGYVRRLERRAER